MASIDQELVLLTCGDRPVRRFPFHGSRPAARLGRVPGVLAHVPAVALPARPGKDDVDPVLKEREPRRVIVHGDDADLASVLVRLLRRDLLHVEVAFVPAVRRSAAALAWELPRDAAALALDGPARPTPLIRDDAGGVLVGRGVLRDVEGEAYCDNSLVLRGRVRRLVAVPGPGGVSALPGKGVRAATGRALQIGSTGARVEVEGVPHPRPAPRWTWYRHTADWLLVRP
ncbi:hypothetical protein LWC33_29695 [Pseudonocardia sp. RS11V-5]|uniref:hypothetical protein n=1 Tax=Pseudonocardia terrae TaxID=2905831 RepID=UPI001E4B8F89|nr:hypothetical protein [Pseudonocardia terrae]MCE3555605.1 hypothetical protein [Pseudonocardia terrae]